MTVRILHGDAFEQLATLADESVHSICTDPPYEIGFMGRAWDSSGIANSVELWTECLRVLKPGGHLLSFGGSRTYHRMACAIEDAGFEIRDQIMWVYGSGFPKSLDVSKAIDKAAGAEREVVGFHERDDLRKNGAGFRNLPGLSDEGRGKIELTAPATESARQWQGWGTALKPAHEPIVVARKPLIGTVAANVLKHGTGAINVDGCRVQTSDDWTRAEQFTPAHEGYGNGMFTNKNAGAMNGAGRWPANIIHDGSDEVLAGFPELHGAGFARDEPFNGTHEGGNGWGNIGVGRKGSRVGDSGSAARFFKECRWDNENSAPRASDAASRSDSCGTPTAASNAKGSQSGGKSEESQLTLDSTSDSKSCIQSQSHAPADQSDVIDTTPTTATRCVLNGSARPAIDASTNSASGVRAAAGIDRGQATRFWYSAKASRDDRNIGCEELEPIFSPTMGNGIGGKEHDPETATRKHNHHPTVKPTDLMQYLVRLVTPPGGTVLDPFAGSGSTGLAADREGFDAILIEREAEYVEIARRRIVGDCPLFAELAA